MPTAEEAFDFFTHDFEPEPEEPKPEVEEKEEEEKEEEEEKKEGEKEEGEEGEGEEVSAYTYTCVIQVYNFGYKLVLIFYIDTCLICYLYGFSFTNVFKFCRIRRKRRKKRKVLRNHLFQS